MVLLPIIFMLLNNLNICKFSRNVDGGLVWSLTSTPYFLFHLIYKSKARFIINAEIVSISWNLIETRACAR